MLDWPLKITVLGSGTSQGVPMIGCDCEVCRSPDPRDNRTRCSLYLETPEGSVLIDTSPELRVQAIREGLSKVDAVLITHTHADHIMGFDDLRRFCDERDSPLPLYAAPFDMERIRLIYPYGFPDESGGIRGYVRVEPHVLGDEPFELFGFRVETFPLQHGRFTVQGFLFSRDGQKRFAYLTDCAEISDEIADRIRGVDLLIADGLRPEPHPTHMSMEQAVEGGRRAEARRIWLTHITHHLTHEDREKLTPDDVHNVYDGLRLEA